MLLTNSKHSLSITGHWLGSNRWAVSCERQQWSDNKITCSLERRRISSKFESLVCLLISGVVSLWWFRLFAHVSVRLYSYRSQNTSKFDKNISNTLGCASWATYLYLTSSVSYSSTDARKHGIYLLSKYTLETFADLMNVIQSMLGMFIPVYKTLRYAKCVGKKTHKVKQKDWKNINSISILFYCLFLISSGTFLVSLCRRNLGWLRECELLRSFYLCLIYIYVLFCFFFFSRGLFGAK